MGSLKFLVVLVLSQLTLPMAMATQFDQELQLELEQNLKKPNAEVPFFHAYPAPKFPGIYLWDSAFISLVWKNLDPNIAKDVLRSVLHFQHRDGKISHQVSFPLGAILKSSYSQPPLLSFAAAEIALETSDLAFAQEVYPKLKSYQQWLWKNRRLRNGLFFWEKTYESGIDNSPRFSNRDESKVANTHVIAAIDFASYVVLDSESMMKLAQFQLSQLDPNSEEGQALLKDLERYESQIQQITDLTRRYLWDAQDGMFYDLNVKTGALIRVPTIASFLPLFAGIASQEQWLAMREHLLNKNEFNTPMPLPTVARNSHYFEKDCWRGPIWINTSYMVIRGVRRYGDKVLARDLSERTVEGVFKTWENTHKFVEFYDPENDNFNELTRKRGEGFMGLWFSMNPVKELEYLIEKRMFLGDKPVDHFVGWTGLIRNIFLEKD